MVERKNSDTKRNGKSEKKETPRINHGQRYTFDGWREGLYCVVCATTISHEEAHVCKMLNIAGCCAQHVDAVVEEIMKDIPMWPSDWFGRWWLTATRGWYTSIDPYDRNWWLERYRGE